MSRGIGRREGDVWRRGAYGGGAQGGNAPFASRILHANYANREIVLAGTDVAGWGDVVGSRDFVQADTTKDPLYGLFTAQPALVFDDVNDFMASSNVNLAPYSQVTLAFAAQWLGAGSGMLMEASTNAGTNAGAMYVYENAGTYQVIYRNSAASRTRGAGITAGVHRMIIVFDVVGASAIPTLYVDGVSSGAAPGAADVAFGSYPWYIGMRAGTSEPWGGKLGDNLIYNGALTVAEIAVVDAWLASRCT